MRLFEAIIEANHRAVAGDQSAGVRPADFADELPLIALTCVDPRLNAFFPNVLALPGEEFIWLRNAGNIITGPLSSTMRSLALACAVKGGREIAIIGHTDCQVCKTSTMKLTDAFRALGVERAGLPENLTEFFGLFASERQNVIKAVDYVRHSPIIGPKIPVHGLIVDIATGKLEWVVNGYQTLDTVVAVKAQSIRHADESIDAMKSFEAFKMGEMKFPDTKIGELATGGRHWPPPSNQPVEVKAPEIPAPHAVAPAPPPLAPRVPVPPPIRPVTYTGPWVRKR
jgi:carbonic anhydrase